MKKGVAPTLYFVFIAVSMVAGALCLYFNTTSALRSFPDMMQRISHDGRLDSTRYIEIDVPNDQNAAMLLAGIFHLTVPLTDDENNALYRSRSNATVSAVDVETLSLLLKKNEKFISEARRALQLATYFDGDLFHPEKTMEPSPQKTLAVLLPCFEASSLLGLMSKPVDVKGAIDLLELADLLSKTPASIVDYSVYYFAMKKWTNCVRRMMRKNSLVKKDDILSMLRHVESIQSPSNVYETTLSTQIRLADKLYELAIIGNGSLIGNNTAVKKGQEEGLVDMVFFICSIQDWLHESFDSISEKYVAQRNTVMADKDKYILAQVSLLSPLLEETLSLETEIGLLKMALCHIVASGNDASSAADSLPMCPGTAYRTNRMTGKPFRYQPISSTRFMIDATSFAVPEVVK